MKLAKITNEQFVSALRQLMVLPGVNPKAMFAIRGIAKVVAEESTKFEETRRHFINEFADKDDAGEVIKPTPTTIKIKPEHIKDLDVALKELGDIDIKLPEIKFSDLGPSPALNAQDLYNLEFIVE